MDITEKRIIECIDRSREQILAFARDIYDHGELGYKEFRTSDKFAEWMEKLALPMRRELAITGVKAYLNPEKKEKATLALIGELDALRIPSHAHYNPETQGAHCCGHNAQLAGVAGAAIALTDPLVKEALDGQVIFFAVPAEEYGEIAFKNELVREGKIRYGGGKCELIRLGEFDEIDLSVVHHTSPTGIELGCGSGNGFVSKIISYRGRASHAAKAPEKGINALSAASLGLNALAFNRETFRDEDCVRVHPIMTKGGDLVNVVPEETALETLVRAKTLAAIEDASAKTDRSFLAGAMALGASCTIETVPGYLPTLPQAVTPEMEAAMRAIAGDRPVEVVPASYHKGSSSDVGDLQHIMPVITFRTGGVTGGLHQADFTVVDEEEAYIMTAKMFALSAYHLLKNGAVSAREITGSYHPRFADKEAYIEYMEAFNAKKGYPEP